MLTKTANDDDSIMCHSMKYLLASFSPHRGANKERKRKNHDIVRHTLGS